MSVEEQLRAQDWGRIRAKLTACAWRALGWGKEREEDAADMAQEAIARAFQREGGWDPEKQPLLRYLCNRVIGMVKNDRRLFRNRFEVPLRDDDRDDGAADDPAGGSHGREEHDAPDAGSLEPLEHVIDKRRYGVRFRVRIVARLAGDEIALAVVNMMLEGIEGVEEQAAHCNYSLAELRFARRRVFHHAHRIAKELASERAGAAEVEVSR
jgi:hypothetical protein